MNTRRLTRTNTGKNTEETLSQATPIPLHASPLTIGSHPDNCIVLNHHDISEHHALLEQMRNGAYRIVDLASTHHIYVNDQRVKSHILMPGNELRIGTLSLIYAGNRLVPRGEQRGIHVDALNLSVTHQKHFLIHDLSIDIPPNSLVAVIGGSGVGKSTLLNALSGIQPASQGKVLYNELDYYRHLGAFSTQLGYVPQEDIIHRRLTVKRALYYTARLRLPGKTPRREVYKRINEVLNDVELSHRRDLLVSRLSGGERKRISIALELLSNPSIFFLDEPTSGLDAGLDNKMMLLLRRLADKGHTIVLVTHTTTNIDVCDYVCFLARGGRLAYYGSPEEARKYFGTARFAEMYTLLEPTEDHPEVPIEAEERFRQSYFYKEYIDRPLHRRDGEQRSVLKPEIPVRKSTRGHLWRQFALLCLRYLELLKNDTGNLLILLLQAPIIGLILFFLAGSGTFDATSIVQCPTRANILDSTGPIVSIDCQRIVRLLNSPQGKIAVQQREKSKEQILHDAIMPNSGADAQTILFIMGFAAVLFGCINGAREIVKELPIYRRERMVNLGIAPYLFSKVAVLGALCLLQSFILVFLVNLKAPLQRGLLFPPFIEIYITMALASLAGLMLGLTISAIAPNADRAMSFVPLVLLPQVIFSGILFKLDTPFLKSLGAIFAMRWAMAGMGSTVGLHADKLGVDGFAYQGTLFVSLNAQSVQAHAVHHLLLVWLILAVISIALGLVIALCMKRKDVRR